MKTLSFTFWQKWLYNTSILFACIGVVLAFFNDSIFFSLWNEYLQIWLGIEGEMPSNLLKFKDFILAPLGGTIAGSYILMAFIAKYPFRNREKWAWQAAVLSLLTWFVIDSSISFYHGAYFNIVLINLFTLVLQGLPLVFTRKYFVSKYSSTV